MHIEILVEDSSGTRLLDILMPKFLGPHGKPHTWRLHAYKGIGKIPGGLSARADPAKRILLDQLRRLLLGYSKTPGIDAVVVVLDTDKRDCKEFLGELKDLASACRFEQRTLFRLAIEELEAWYLGDREALLAAYPRAKRQTLENYRQDSVCGTWETLADIIHLGGSTALRNSGWPTAGQMKHEWAEKIGPRMNPHRNLSPSFGKLRDGLHRLAARHVEAP